MYSSSINVGEDVLICMAFKISKVIQMMATRLRSVGTQVVSNLCPCVLVCFYSGPLWMPSTALSGCWPPVPRGYRWSVVKRPLQTPEPLLWTTSSSLSRSSSVPTTSPRPPNNWSPSPLERKNSKDVEEGEEREKDKCMG